jgi:hypothetical protein
LKYELAKHFVIFLFKNINILSHKAIRIQVAESLLPSVKFLKVFLSYKIEIRIEVIKPVFQL